MKSETKRKLEIEESVKLEDNIDYIDVKIDPSNNNELLGPFISKFIILFISLFKSSNK